MSSLIEELQRDTTSQDVPITVLLRKAKLAAVKLSQPDFTSWIEHEMNGFGEGQVPPYRHVSRVLKWLNPYQGWQHTGITGTAQILQPIAELEAFAAGDSDHFTAPADPKLAARVSKSVELDVRVDWHISRAAMLRILSGVRDMLLDWALKLEQAGVRGDGLSFTAAERKAAEAVTIHNVFHAPVGAVAQAGSTASNVTQSNTSATPAEIASAVATLLAELQSVGASATTHVVTGELQAIEPELRAGRVPFAKMQKVLDVLAKGQDVVLKAPRVVDAVRQIGKLLGYAE